MCFQVFASAKEARNLKALNYALEVGNVESVDDFLANAGKIRAFIDGTDQPPQSVPSEQPRSAAQPLEEDGLQAKRDRRLGIRVRRRWAEILVIGERYSLNEQQIRGFVAEGGLFASDPVRVEIATRLGFDWAGAADFFSKIAPVIIEMMAACGA